jgi:hypothetical protein
MSTGACTKDHASKLSSIIEGGAPQQHTSTTNNIKIRQYQVRKPLWPANAMQSLLLALPTPKARKDIVFRFIIEYSSLRDFGPLGNNNRSIFI